MLPCRCKCLLAAVSALAYQPNTLPPALPGLPGGREPLSGGELQKAECLAARTFAQSTAAAIAMPPSCRPSTGLPTNQPTTLPPALPALHAQVIVIDEIGTEAECLAARTIAQRGVQLVATAHGGCGELWGVQLCLL